MTVQQIYALVNAATAEILGEGEVLAEDLSNIVDIGTAVMNANAVDNYVRNLVNHIGRVIFVNRPYSGAVPSVVMDNWEFGSIMEKVRAKLPEAHENESWQLEDGQTYDTQVFYKPEVEAKFFNKRTTFEIPVSITEKQVKESFDNVAQLNGFISMIYDAVDKSMTIKLDGLVMRTINNFIGETMYDAFPSGDYSGTSVKAINLLKLYNDKFPDATTTVEECLTNPDFVRFAVYQMDLTAERMKRITTLFNIEATPKFTPKDMLHFILHGDFKASTGAYLQADTFHNEYVNLPNYESVPFWQGSGTAFDFGDTAEINIKTASGHDVHATGIIGIMFDKDALGVTNLDRRVTTSYNAKGEFFNNYYKMDAGYFNDTQENFVVFYVAEDET